MDTSRRSETSEIRSQMHLDTVFFSRYLLPFFFYTAMLFGHWVFAPSLHQDKLWRAKIKTPWKNVPVSTNRTRGAQQIRADYVTDIRPSNLPTQWSRL